MTDSDSNYSLRAKPWWRAGIFPIWLFISFYSASIIVVSLNWLLIFLNFPLDSLNFAVLNSSIAALVYLITLFIVIAVPLLVKKYSTSRDELGLKRLPLWSDILIAPAGYVIYFLLSAILIVLFTSLLPDFNVRQDQVTGFKGIAQEYQYYLAFITLVIIAPVAEEILFRGYLYAKMKKYIPIWVSVITTSLIFGIFHIFGTDPIAWSLAIDTFALSIVLCILRETTGGIWAPILLHMLKNGVAFYLLFINPSLLTTLVR